jgi:putative BNR repeat neuraminidase
MKSSSLIILFCIVATILATPVHAQQATANGYKGIWFALGQVSTYGDKYSGGLGTYTSSHIPVAIYAPKVNKTFFVYGGTTAADQRHLLIMLSYFDHTKKRVPRPVIVLDKQGVDDPHDNASLSIDEKGYIWVFVSGRNTSRPGVIFKSRSPYQIDTFDKIREGEMTYPQPWWLEGKGFLYLFTKYTKGRELYWSTSNDGISWAADLKLAGMGGHYQVSNRWKNKVVTVFNYHPNGNVDKRTNVYLLQTSDMGKSWTNISGASVQTPITNKVNATLVKDYEAEGKLVYLNDLGFDKDGNPVILAVISKNFQPGPPGEMRDWVIIQWKNNKWQTNKVCESSHNYDMGSLYINDGQWQIIGPTEPGPQKNGTGGEMAVWKSNDAGENWYRAKSLTSGSSRNHSYARRPFVRHPGFQAFWADGNADKLSISKLFFCDSAGNVYELPYDMKNEFEVPKKVIGLIN